MARLMEVVQYNYLLDLYNGTALKNNTRTVTISPWLRKNYEIESNAIEICFAIALDNKGGTAFPISSRFIESEP